MSHESNAYSVFSITRVRMSPCVRDQLNAKDADMEKVLLSCDVTCDVQSAFETD